MKKEIAGCYLNSFFIIIQHTMSMQKQGFRNEWGNSYYRGTNCIGPNNHHCNNLETGNWKAFRAVTRFTSGRWTPSTAGATTSPA